MLIQWIKWVIKLTKYLFISEIFIHRNKVVEGSNTTAYSKLKTKARYDKSTREKGQKLYKRNKPIIEQD